MDNDKITKELHNLLKKVNPKVCTEQDLVVLKGLLHIYNDKWITIHPNGEDNKGRHLLLKDGESPQAAIKRTYGADESITTTAESKNKEGFLGVYRPKDGYGNSLKRNIPRETKEQKIQREWKESKEDKRLIELNTKKWEDDKDMRDFAKTQDYIYKDLDGVTEDDLIQFLKDLNINSNADFKNVLHKLKLQNTFVGRQKLFLYYQMVKKDKAKKGV